MGAFMKRILILGIGSVALKYLPSALRTAGYEPVFLLDPADYVGEPRARLLESRTFPAGAGGDERVRRLLESDPSVLENVVAVTGLFDEKYPFIKQIAEKYGLECPADPIIRIADKAEVARLIPEFSPPGFVCTSSSMPGDDKLAATFHETGAVLKPAVATGAEGIVFFEPHELSRDSLIVAMGENVTANNEGGVWVLQQRLHGDLISLEGYASGAEIVPLGFSRRRRVEATEVANSFPADHTLSSRIQQRSMAAIEALVDRAGMSNSYFHCEFLVAGDNCHLIDVNAGRIAGGGIVEQIALSHGVDPGDILVHVLLLGLGGKAEAPAYVEPHERRETLNFSYGLEKGGVVRSIRVPETISSLHTQFVQPGFQVPPVGVSDYSWIGLLTGLPDEAARDIERVRIETDSGMEVPYYGAEFPS